MGKVGTVGRGRVEGTSGSPRFRPCRVRTYGSRTYLKFNVRSGVVVLLTTYLKLRNYYVSYGRLRSSRRSGLTGVTVNGWGKRKPKGSRFIITEKGTLRFF